MVIDPTYQPSGFLGILSREMMFLEVISDTELELIDFQLVLVIPRIQMKLSNLMSKALRNKQPRTALLEDETAFLCAAIGIRAEVINGTAIGLLDTVNHCLKVVGHSWAVFLCGSGVIDLKSNRL